ncbi:MAG: hypothetical protein K5668_01400 [Lachnospiraceae bacterium]|nr:hypothetical protein [Lachnospiraceae bacterium]
MIAKIIDKFSLPDNLAVYALMETLIVFLIVLIAGFVINTVNTLVTNLLSGVIGQMPAFVIRNYLTYPGTVHHELSHALIAFITGAKVVKINLFPKGNALGSVDLEPRGNIILRSLQLSLSAIAPVVLGSVSLFLLWTFVLTNITEVWQYILFWYIFVSILFHMCMSPPDYANFFKGLIPSVLVIFLVFLLLGAFGIMI